MDVRNSNQSKGTSVWVLSRPSSSSEHPQPSATPTSQYTLPSLPEGVVVVGFVSRTLATTSQIVNRVLDSNVFGSGNFDKPFPIDGTLDDRQRLKYHQISYYHDEDKGVVFLQFCSSRFSLDGGSPNWCSEVNSFWGDEDSDELKGLLFVFSVCHVVIYVQDGSNFDTRLLKKFRVLQTAKHAFAPYIRAKEASQVPSRPHSSLNFSKPSKLSGASPGSAGSKVNRNVSASTIVSNTACSNSLFPGHVVPVVLFVFIDEFPDASESCSSAEDAADNPPINQSSGTAKQKVHSKGSGPVVMLTRQGNKSDVSFRKKLHSGLEAQVRFLIKKCRILTVPEISRSSRSGAAINHSPLFSLDAAKAVALLDRSSIRVCESLEFTINLVEDISAGKAASDVLLLESHAESSSKEDVVVLREFIYRQSDIIRGKGGLTSGSSSASGVGMVAVAAAAAAASASSGKAFSAPNLPTLDMWLISSRNILQSILSAKSVYTENSAPLIHHLNKQEAGSANIVVKTKKVDAKDLGTYQLDFDRGLNTKFSESWCERALPVAMDVYMEALPPCYTTSLHKAHLEKALHSFFSMVRGPAVEMFAKKLEANCESIWMSGRQQCDAVSLTGKPCVLKKHDLDMDGEPASGSQNSHSSGYFFLLACSCGRSRSLRSDPFDFESANVSFNCFPDCDMRLPAAHLPECNSCVIRSSSWKVVRIGSSNEYDSSKGMIQSGFSSSQRFLFKWMTKPLMSKSLNILFGSYVQHASDMNPKVEDASNIGFSKDEIAPLKFGNVQSDHLHRRQFPDKSNHDDKQMHTGGVFPHVAGRKFAEVVAGSSTLDSFPPLMLKKPPSEKVLTQNRGKNYSEQSSVSSVQNSQINEGKGQTSTGTDHMGKTKSSAEPVVVLVGFEHECPRGHRFFLSPDQLDELPDFHPAEATDCAVAVEPSTRFSNGKHRNTAKHVAPAPKNWKGINVTKEIVSGGNVKANDMTKVHGLSKLPNRIARSAMADSSSVEEDDIKLHELNLDDGGSAFNMLHRDLPLFMNCPYCSRSKPVSTTPEINFPDAISQLRRIFVVTPPFQFLVATRPVVRFEASSQAMAIGESPEFSFGSPVVLPPDSFVAITLPFVYGIRSEDGALHPLHILNASPQRTARIIKGTALHFVSKAHS